MIDFLTGCFDLLFDLTAQCSNILVLLPFCAIVLSILISVTFNLIRGDYK